jgi:hypothetical protein
VRVLGSRHDGKRSFGQGSGLVRQRVGLRQPSR